MSKALKALLAIAAVAAIGVVGIVAYVATLDFDRYKPMIAAQVKAAIGRDLEIKGKIAPQLGLTPVVVVEGVTLANAPWGEKRPMVSVERFEAKLQLVPLVTSFGKRIVVDRVLIKGADIWLETDEKGVGNWKFDADAPGAPPAPPPPAVTAGGEPPPDVVVMDVELQAVKLWFKAGKAAPTVLAIDQATMHGDTAESPRRVDGKGSYNKLGFALVGQVGSVGALMKGPFPLDLAFRFGERAAVKVAGQVREPLATKDYELTITAEMPEVGQAGALAAEAGVPNVTLPALGPLVVELKVADKAPNGRPSWTAVKLALGTAETMRVTIDGSVRDPLGPAQTPRVAPGALLRIDGGATDLAKLAQKLGTTAPVSGPLKISGEIADQGIDKLALKGFSIAAAGSDFTGDGVLGYGGAKPSVSGKFRSKMVDLTKFAPAPGTGGGTSAGTAAAPADGRVIPDTALPFDVLDKADADLELTIDALRAPTARIDNLRAKLAMSGGNLVLKPATFDMDGGKFTIETTLTGKDRALVQKIEGRGIEVGRILQERNLNDWFRGGRTSIDVSATGQGATARAIAASLNGNVTVNMGPGEIGQAAQRVIGQWLSAISPALGQIQLGTSVRCAVYSIGFNDGIGSLRQGVLETTLVTANTSGTINLRNEQLALRTQAGPIGVRTTGSLARPQTGVDAAGTVQGVIEGAAGAAIGTAGGVVGGVLGAITGSGGGGGGGGCGGGGGSSGGGGQQQRQQGIPLPGGGNVPLPGGLPNPFRR